MSYEGLLIQCGEAPQPEKVYVVLPEGASWIPNPTVAERLFGSSWSSEIQQLSLAEFNAIQQTTPLSDYAVLATGSLVDSGKVYLVTGNEKRWIVSPSVMDKYDFENGTIYGNQVVLAAIPDGINIT